MKKHIAIFAAAILALIGCSSRQAGNSTPVETQPAEGNSAAAVASAVTEIAQEIAIATEQLPQEPRTEPPQLQVIYSGDGLATCAAMTLGTYSWDAGGSVVCADSIGGVACAAEGLIHAVVDLDTVAENEPKINLWGGAELTAVQLLPLEGEDVIPLDFTAEGVISVPADVYDGVVQVSAKFPEGQADYFFMVKRSLTDPTTPPQLRVFTGGIGFSMTKGAYDWTYTIGDETCNDITDVDSPWTMYQNGHVRPVLSVFPGEAVRIMLSEGGSIVSAQLWTSESDIQPLEYSGGALTMPNRELSGVCCISVNMPAGTCDYLFAVNIGESFSSPAAEPIA